MCREKGCHENRSLDKLAQLGNFGKKQNQTWQKKARAKCLTNAITKKLLSANTRGSGERDGKGSIGYRSPLTKAYLRTFTCNQYLFQEGYKVTSHYCKNRWCIVCNRIRAAHLINGYLPSLAELENKQFVTLTIPNCTARELPQRIEDMYKAFVKVKGQLKKAHQKGQLDKFNGLRKIECTYNPRENTYHPHYHLIVEGKEMAEQLVIRWLNQFPEATHKAQDIRAAQEGSELEMFKYFTKLFNEGEIHAKALDAIFVAIKGRRIFQNYGSVKKVSEDILELQSEETTHKGYRTEVWKWIDEAFDWITSEGEVFAEYEPSPKVRDLCQNPTNHTPKKNNQNSNQIHGYHEGKHTNTNCHQAKTHKAKGNEQPCREQTQLQIASEVDGDGIRGNQCHSELRCNEP